MKAWYAFAFILGSALIAAGIFLRHNQKAIPNFLMPASCTERLLTKVDIAQSCPSPSHIMKVGEQWICSCRSEEQTMKGIKSQ